MNSGHPKLSYLNLQILESCGQTVGWMPSWMWDSCWVASLLWPSVSNISKTLRALTLKHFQTCTAFLWGTLKSRGKWMISPECPRCQDFLLCIFRLHVSYIFYFMMYLCTSKCIHYIYIYVYIYTYIFIMLLFSCSVTSNSLRPHGPQQARLPCPSPFPRACSNSCPLSQWCHPPILSSVFPFSSCLQSFPASGSFLMSQLFSSGGQSFGASASASVFPVNIKDWFPLGLTGLISLQSKGISRVFPNTIVQMYLFFGTQTSLWSSSYIHTWLLEKP